MIRHMIRSASLRGAAYQMRTLSTTCIPRSKQLNPDVAHNRSYNSKEGFVWKSGYEPISIPDMTLDEYVWKNVAKWENKIAIVSINIINFLSCNFFLIICILLKGLWYNWPKIYICKTT